MNALLLAAMLATPVQGPAPDETDVRCYRLMAELARAEDPAARALGIGAAQYFLGRIDAAAPGYDVAAEPPVAEGDRAALLARCTAALDENGFDPRALGASLEPAEPAI
ncbi:MAG TPA: hypothetical protein VF702_10170 [Allosphingosinicella sp.]|jgi:hypothetical protein